MNASSKRWKGLCLKVLLFVGLLELSSYIGWKLVVAKPVQKTVRALCGQTKTPRRVPNTFWHHDLNPKHEEYKAALNSKNTLGEEFDLPKPPGELRIVCVGDSTTEGVGVASWKDAYPNLLEQHLKQSLSPSSSFRSIKVINAGVGSHNSAFNLEYMALRLIHFEADAFVIKSAYNDFLPYIKPGMTYDYLHAFPHPFTMQGSSNPFWHLARYSHFLKGLGVILFREEVASPQDEFSGKVTRDELQDLNYEPNKAKFHIHAENLRSMVLLAKGRGKKVYLLDMPTSPNAAHFKNDAVVGQKFHELIEHFNASAKRIAQEEGVPFVVTAPLRAEDFVDHCHNTREGNDTIAKKVAERIREDFLK